MQQVGETHIKDAFENEIITVYFCNANSVTDLNPNESSDGAFMTAEQIRQRGDAHETTPHLLGALEVYRTSEGSVQRVQQEKAA